MNTHRPGRVLDCLHTADRSGVGDVLTHALGNPSRLGLHCLLDVAFPDLGANLRGLRAALQPLVGPAKKKWKIMEREITTSCSAYTLYIREGLVEILHFWLAYLLVVWPALLLSFNLAIVYLEFLKDDNLNRQHCGVDSRALTHTYHIPENILVAAALGEDVGTLGPVGCLALGLVDILALLLPHGVALLALVDAAALVRHVAALVHLLTTLPR